MASLFTELRRRNVFRVAAAYALMGWVLAQVADLFLESFGAPDWVMKTVLLILLLGFPVAVILAWAFELTPEGLRRDADVDRSIAAAPATGRRLNLLIVAMLAIAAAFFVGTRFGNAPEVNTVVPPTSSPTTPPRTVGKSIAVLPFATFAADNSDSHLADGLAETLLNRLAQIDTLQVAARTSAFKFKGTNEDIRIIGGQLGVETVLEGSIQRSGEKIRITAQLINVADGFHLYSENFDREVTDLFAVQDEIAEAVVKALRVELLGAPQASSAIDVEAYEALARLRSQLVSASAEELAEVIVALTALTHSNPTYAEAHATLSEVYGLLGTGAGEIPEDDFDQAIAAARRAVDVAPNNAIGYVALGQALIGRGRFSDAVPVVSQALALQPGNADALVTQGILMSRDFRFQDALDVTASALLRDPLNSQTRRLLAERHLDLGQPAEGLAVIELGLELEPNSIALLLAKGQYLRNTGQMTESALMAETVLRLDPNNVGGLQNRVYLPLAAGDFTSALRALEAAEARSVDRLADERALYCFETRDRDCWHAATTRMLANRNRFFVQLWQARMLSESNLLEEAIAALLPVVAYFDETGDVYGNHMTRTSLAYLHGLNGDLEARDAVLTTVFDTYRKATENGYDHWILSVDLAAAHAASGNPEESVRMLEEAFQRGFRLAENLPYFFAFDSLADRPDYQALIQRLRADCMAMWVAADIQFTASDPTPVVSPSQ